MIVDIGYFSLVAAFVLNAYAVLACITGIQKDSDNLIMSARYSLIAGFLLVAFAYFSLSYAFLTNDFSIRFVAMHSSTDLPPFYKLTAVWGGMEGSLLLWELILSFFILVILFRYDKSNRENMPYILSVLGVISVFLLFLLIGWSNPLVREYPVPPDGLGLNPLLQNPGMVFHPPSLYLGYVGFSVPFAFAIASLISGKLDNQWILTTRRWTLFSWFFLTLGMILGAQWAYVELGWGGYWSWDPVENASLMPWLTGTAFLHSVIVQEKRNSLKIWNMLLIIATYALSILGTFITRSGILSSVHSFSKSNIGPAFLVFIAMILVVSNGLILYRQSMLSTQSKTAGVICKENAFLLNNVVFVTMAFTVLYGTVFPLLAEALANKKLSIQAPFFNTIMAPIAVLMIFLMGVTHVLGWKKTSMRLLSKNVLIPIGLSLILMIITSLLLHASWQWYFLAGSTIFAGLLLIRELFYVRRSVKSPRTQESGPLGKRFLMGLMKDGRRRGGLIIHIGIVLLFIGVCGSFFNLETSFTFSPGETKTVKGYVLKHAGNEEKILRNSRNVGINIDVYKNDQRLDRLTPVKSYYPTSSQPMTEVAIRRTLLEDLYISLSSLNDDGSATVVVHVNPLVNFVWLSMLFFVVGTLYSLSYKPVQLRKQGG